MEIYLKKYKNFNDIEDEDTIVEIIDEIITEIQGRVWNDNDNDLRKEGIEYIIKNTIYDEELQEDLRVFYKDVPPYFQIRFNNSYFTLYPGAKTWRDVSSYM